MIYTLVNARHKFNFCHEWDLIPNLLSPACYHWAIICYVNEFYLFSHAQSAYRRCFSTYSAVLKVFSDIIEAIANGKIELLSLIDLIVAFNTINHDILLRWLEVTYGSNGAILQWLRSYVEDLTQSVHLNSSISCPHDVMCGVPQGSVLGPLLFTFYMAYIGIIVQSFDLKYHTYADDNQIYSSCFPAECAQSHWLYRCCRQVGHIHSINVKSVKIWVSVV